MAELAVGRVLGGRYEIVRRLGAGGMGVVYEASDRERSAAVALKTIRRVTPEGIARFKREFRALVDIAHPNLAALYDLVAEEDELFFTMELVPGRPFNSWVRTGDAVAAPARDALDTQTGTEATAQLPVGPSLRRTDAGGTAAAGAAAAGTCDLPKLRESLRQLAEGVAALHAAGMLHRDLKPSNVLVSEHGRVVILDFGLVSEIDHEQLAGTDERGLVGTAAFMSPEQGARMALGPPSDWYSVGVMLYLALTGRLPFAGGRDDVLMDKQRFEPPPPYQIAAGVPEDLDALCVELLRRDPRRRPDGREILRRLGGASEQAALLRTFVSSPAAGLVVGRDAQLAVLREALRGSRTGSVLARVHGPSGMGKTSLVRTFLDGLRDDVVVLRGRCYERESVPFKAVDGIIDELARYLARLPQIDAEGLMPRDAPSLARLFPVLRQVEALVSSRRRAALSPDPHELRRRGFAALRELLVRIADRTPLVIAIDDLQWGDADSALLLASVLRGPEPPPLLLVASYRSEDVDASEFLRELDRQVAALELARVEIGVEPLAPAQARQLALLHWPELGDSPGEVDRIVDESQGNPFFVEELTRHLRELGGSSGVSLDQALQARMLRLSPPADRLLSMIAVAARPIPQELALRAASVDDPAALALLRAGSFVRVRAVGGNHHLEPYHDRIRELAVGLLPEDELRACHQRLAFVYEATPAPDPETLAVHLAGAGDSVRAAEFAITAARRAATALAFDRAARLLRSAMALDARFPRELHIELGDALAFAGRGREAAEAYLAALPGAEPADALDLECRAAGQLLYSGYIERGLELFTRIAQTTGTHLAGTPRRALAAMLFHRARIAVRGLTYRERSEREVPASELTRVDVGFAVAEGMGMIDIPRAAELQARHLLMALKCGEPHRVARALAAEAIFRSLPGRPSVPRTKRVLGMLEGIAERLDDPELRGLHLGAAGLCAFNQGFWSECYELADRAEQIFLDECVGFRWELATASMFKSFVLALTGRIREMLTTFPAMVEEAYERGDLYAATSLLVCVGFYLPLASDDPDQARAQIDEALARWPAIGFHVQHANALHSGVCVDLYRGRPADAVDRCAAAWPALQRSLLLRVQFLRTLLGSARARAMVATVRAGGDPSLLRPADRWARRARAEGVDYAVGMGCSVGACVALCRDDRDGAIQLLAEADQQLTASGLMLAAWSNRRARGLLLGGSDGAALVDEVDGILTAQGLKQPARVCRIFAPGFEPI